MVRPSISSTDRLTSSIATVLTRVAALGAKEAMPGLQKVLPILVHQPEDFRKIAGVETRTPDERQPFKPELGRRTVLVNLNMGRLAGCVAVEIEPVAAGPQYGRHLDQLSRGRMSANARSHS